MPTRNDLADNAKKTSIGVLQGCLTDGVDLYNATRQAHWNVKGPHFAALHTLFEGFYTTLAEDIDALAERIVQLGGTANGTSQWVAQGTRLPAYPADLKDGMAHVAALESKAESLHRMAESLRHLAAHCHGDHRPDCPILEDLARKE